MENADHIKEILRATKLVRHVGGHGITQIEGMSIKPGDIAWVSKMLAYHLLEKYQGGESVKIEVLQHNEIDSSHLKKVYKRFFTTDPWIRERLTHQQRFYYLIENPEELIALMKTDHGKAMSEVAPTAQALLDEERAQRDEKAFDMIAEKVVEKIGAGKKPETSWDEFELLMEEAIKVQNPTKDDLWDWKNKFKKYSEDYRSYFGRYAEREKISLDSIPALAWRGNQKFRKSRSKKIG